MWYNNFAKNLINIEFTKLNSNIQNAKGKPRKYLDEQIVNGVKNSIFSLRELEYHIKQDYKYQSIIKLVQVPNYSTFLLRSKIL